MNPLEQTKQQPKSDMGDKLDFGELGKRFNDKILKELGGESVWDCQYIILTFIQREISSAKSQAIQEFVGKIKNTRKEAWDNLHAREQWAIKDEVIMWLDQVINLAKEK